MKLNELKPAEGSTTAARRLGRGTGSGLGQGPLDDQCLIPFCDGLLDGGDGTVDFFADDDHGSTSQPSVRMVSRSRIIFSRMGPKYQGTSFFISF